VQSSAIESRCGFCAPVGNNITVTSPAANADKDHDPDLDTIDAPLSMIRKGLLMMAIEAFAAKHPAGAGHVFGR
jgi:hypothetical protein